MLGTIPSELAQLEEWWLFENESTGNKSFLKLVPAVIFISGKNLALTGCDDVMMILSHSCCRFAERFPGKTSALSFLSVRRRNSIMSSDQLGESRSVTHWWVSTIQIDYIYQDYKLC